MQTDLNPVYINYIRWKKKEGRREREIERKKQEVTPVMGKHNFIIVMTRSATVALGLGRGDEHTPYTIPRIQNWQTIGRIFHASRTATSRAHVESWLRKYPGTARPSKAHLHPLFLQPSASSTQPTSGVAWRDGGVAYTLAKRELSIRYTRTRRTPGH